MKDMAVFIFVLVCYIFMVGMTYSYTSTIPNSCHITDETRQSLCESDAVTSRVFASALWPLYWPGRLGYLVGARL